MSDALLLPTEAVEPLDAESLRLLERAYGEGREVLADVLVGPEAWRGDVFAAVPAVFQRWKMEALMSLAVRGPTTYGDLSRALGGVPSGSLAPKLKELVASGLVERDAKAEGRVVYALAPSAHAVGAAMFAVTTAKAHHHATLREGRDAPPWAQREAFRLPRTDASGVDGRVERFVDATQAFLRHRVARAAAPGLEDALATARRFTVACNRKWHAAVVFDLLANGPSSFVDLRDRTGAGDQALATALRELVDLRDVERDAAGAYRVAPFGLFDFSFGTSLCVVYERVTRALPQSVGASVER